MTLFGGAILWIRADRARLPANDAVSVVPNSVLVTTGASFLVPAVLLALFAVTVLSVVHLSCLGWRKFRERKVFEQLRSRRRNAEAKGRDADAKVQLAQAARALATTLAESADQANKNPTASDPLKEELNAAAATQWHQAELQEREALAEAAEAAKEKAAVENAQAKAGVSLERPLAQYVTELVIGAVVLLFVPPIVNGAICHLPCLQVVVLILVAVAATLMSLAAYMATERFVWFGVVAFITVGVYIGFATYFSTIENSKVEPAAVVRTDRPPVIGIYIADTASNVYLGTFPRSGRPSRLLVVPRTQVTDLAIGPLLEREKARRRAVALALEECKLEIKIPKTDTTHAFSKHACNDAEQEALEAYFD